MGRLKQQFERFTARWHQQPNLAALQRAGLKLGDHTIINRGVLIDPDFAWLISIGTGTTIAPRVVIMAHDASVRNLLGYTSFAPVSIGSFVYIGIGAMILPGVTIGDRTVIGAGSVVTRSIPEGSVAVGVPARVISKTDDRLAKEGHLLSQWKQMLEERGINVDDLHRSDHGRMTDHDINTYLEESPGYLP